jgi:POT family proton-dependent oligopeptide transporter
MKSFIMALFLFSTTVGNLMTAGVNYSIVKPLHAQSVEVGAETWVTLEGADPFVVGQKIDLDRTGVVLAGPGGAPVLDKDGKPKPLGGTFLVSATDPARHRVELMDVVHRRPVATTGTFDPGKAEVSTYKLVGPEYFNFFALAMVGVAVLFIFVALLYKEKTHLRDELEAAAPS